MKRISIIFLSIVMLLSFCGCGSKNNGVSLQLSEDDTQPGWNIYNQRVAKAPNGYYYLSEKENEYNSYIYYMDAKSGQTTVLCNKADCEHSGEECNAFLNRMTYNTQNIYYYKDNIYVLENSSESGLSNLVRISPDGSERETLFEIGTQSVAYKLAFGGDSVYIYNRVGGHGVDNTTESVRRRSLDGKQDDIIYSASEENIQISAVKIYGDKAFILVTKWGMSKETKSMNASGYGVFVYDVEKKSTEKFLDENACDFTIDTKNNKVYYYVINEGIYKRDLSGGKSEKIYSCEDGANNVAHISCDGEYIYMSNEMYKQMIYKVDTYMWVLDTQGTEVNKIPTAGVFATYFGEGDYIFSSEESEHIITYIPKSEITTAKEWKKLPR